MDDSKPFHPKSSSAGSTSGHQPRTIPGPYNCTVFAYPSLGGVVIGRFTGVELEWLGFSRSSLYSECRFSTSRDEGFLKEEDTLALRMLQLGARWWPSREFEVQHRDLSYPYGYHYPPELDVGYPSRALSSSGVGGNAVLLLKTFADNSPMRLPEYDAGEKPIEWSRLAACGTMEERCSVLRDFGATEYDDVRKCSDIPHSLAEGVAEGQRYEELLRKMKDVKYLDEWLMSLDEASV